jgi:hypothetical protein
LAPKDKGKKGIVLGNDLIYEMVETDPCFVADPE